jgi:hypothetical protein
MSSKVEPASDSATINGSTAVYLAMTFATHAADTDLYDFYMMLGKILSVEAATQITLIVIGLSGVVINGFVLFALAAFKQFHKNTTNVFIGNQTVLDTIACAALTVTISLRKNGASAYAIGFSKRILCWFFDNSSFLGAAMNASKFSLVVIAFERYFKVVHPVKHRNNLRPWMVKLGVVAPWIVGLVLVILPISLTSNVIDGVCQMSLQKPEAGMPYCLLMFICQSLIPLLVFIFCYSNILFVVRRQNQVATEMILRRNAAAGQSCSRNIPEANADVVAAEEFSKTRENGGTMTVEDCGNRQIISQTEKKVIRTMLTVTACFIICWGPFDLFMVIYWYLPVFIGSVGSLVLVVLAYVNVLLNAVIYSSHLGTIQLIWRAFRRLFTKVNDAIENTTQTSSRITPVTRF